MADESTDPASKVTRPPKAVKPLATEKPVSEAVNSERIEREGKTAPPPEGLKPLVTEKPVATPRRVGRYIVSVDDATGFIIKMEKLDKEGAPKELSQDEYLAAFTYASYAAPYYAAYASSFYDPLSTPAAQAFLKAAIDMWKSLLVRPETSSK